MQQSCTIEILLKPNAKQCSISIGADGIIHVRVNAPPIDGRANKALIEFLSDKFDIPKSCISIKRGETSKSKVVEIFGKTKTEVMEKLAK